MQPQSCTRMAIVVRLFLYLSFIPPAAFTALRAYALTRCRWLSALVFLLSSVQFVTNMVGLLGYRVFGIHSAAWGCINGIAIPPSSLLGRIPRCEPCIDYSSRHHTRRDHLEAPSERTHGHERFCRHNAAQWYQVLHCVVGAEHLAARAHGRILVPDGVLSYVSYFTDPLSSVLVSHFLLDLQEAHQRTVAGMANNDLLDTSQSISSFPSFPDALGSTGATVIDPAADQGQEEDDGGADEHLAAVEGIHPREVEPIHESPIGDELAISEVPRDGVGGVALGAL
ncbi:hypothetical protein LXA43DRAFT_421874 [Ganoderma leucocontextum]|nr:hypothetical protein LXA43DRAFT_421874 [Ganoderma leucocontextum]